MCIISFIKNIINIFFRFYYCNNIVWNINLSDPWFDYTKNSLKIFEGRRYFDKYKYVKIGDYFCFKRYKTNSNDTFIKKIINIYKFKTFEEGLKYFDSKNLLNKVLPNISTVSEGINIYLKYVSLKTQLKDNVIFFHLE